MYVIRGHVQNYAWGIPGGLARWLPDTTVEDERPQAEMWFGAHPNGPSPLVSADGTLADVVAAHEVPLLVKILAARCPLSIQLHPDSDLAAAWFAEGSDLVSDPFAKEEMLVALEDFAVFAGWRAPVESARLLRQAALQFPQQAQDGTAGRAFSAAAAALDADDIPAAVRTLLAVVGTEVEQAATALRAALPTVGADPAELGSHDLAAATFPGDNGLLVLALLDHRVLAAHSAVYMPVGGVHAYAQGVGLEVMTSSDNVLRLGLTGKRIAVEEALSALRDDGDPHFLSGEAHVHLGQESRVDYQPESAGFHLTLLESGDVELPTGAYRCVLNLEGTTTVRGAESVVELAPGEACAVLADEPPVKLSSVGLAAVVVAG